MKKKLVALGLAVLTTAAMVAGGTLSVMAESDETSGVITMEKSDAEWITQEDIDSLANDQQYVVGFTDNFDGNTLHQQQERYFNDLASAMKDAGIIKDYTMVVANNDVATQVQQIESFIMQGCNLIVVDPCSSSGLDGAIEEAYNAGVQVVVFNDGPVSSKYCTQLNVYQILDI